MVAQQLAYHLDRAPDAPGGAHCYDELISRPVDIFQ
jgi:hypothetical protein